MKEEVVNKADSNDKKPDVGFHHMLLQDDFWKYAKCNKNLIDTKKNLDWIENSENIIKAFNSLSPYYAYEKQDNLLNCEMGAKIKKIDKKFVHKNSSKNVLISEACQVGNIWHFHMLDGIDEFKFDHESDHIQGMLLMEAARQAGIATLHLNGLAEDGRMNLTRMCTDFLNYVEVGESVLIRSISNPIVFEEGKNTLDIFAMVQLMQFGRVCATTVFGSIAFDDKKHIEDFRNRSCKLNKRRASKHKKMLENIKNNQGEK